VFRRIRNVHYYPALEEDMAFWGKW
jgi:hypothetical protein